MAISDSEQYDPLDQLAEEFAARFRRGERPDLKEYTDRYPELADDIRELFPAMVSVEQAEGVRKGDEAKRCGDSHAATPPLRQIGDYWILREIGRGGMGVVYEAEQISLGRRVALKVLPGQASSDRLFQERFRREARAAARLHHTNIVPVYDVGQDGDLQYYAMQFIEGQGLDAVITELRRLLDRARSQSKIQAASGGRSLWPSGEQSRQGIEAPTLAEGVEVSPVLRYILTGRFDPGGQCPELVGASHPTRARALAGDLATPSGTETESRVAESDSGLTSTDTGSATAGDVTGPQPPHPSAPALSPSASTSSSSTILPGGAQLSSVESGHRAFFRSLAQIGRQVAGGLAYAHARGIVHRDIKPSNLLLDTEGVVWIADFGLAKGEDEGLTQSGDILGTIRYMAPERFRGEGDARADIYALGLTLYELLTLRSGYESADRLKMIEQIKTEEPERPRSVDARIPRDLETIVLKAIEKDPKARYQSAAAMGEDLGRFLADEPIVARPISGPERAWRWCRRNPAVALLLGAVAASLLLGMAGTSYYAIQAGNREQEALTNARHAREEKARSDRRWYAAEINLAHRDSEEGEFASLEQRLDVLEPQGPDAPDLRGFEWYHLRRLCRLEMLKMPGHVVPVRSLAFSPDGRRLASAGGNYGTSGEVKVWDMATGRELLCLRGHKDLASCVAFSPDGRRLASANGGVHTPGEIKLWDAADGRELLRLPAHTAPVRGLAFSPDGRQLASAAGGISPAGNMLPGEVKIWDAADGRQLLCIPGNEASDWHLAFTSVAFSPAAAEPRRRLAFADGYTVRVCDPATGKELFTVGKHPNRVNCVAFSPDGRFLASGSGDGTAKVWDADTAREMLALHHAEGIVGLAFSPDNRRLAAAAGNNLVKVWDLTTGEEDLVLRGHKDSIGGVAFSPDGWRLASGSGDGALKIWDATARADAVTLRGPFPTVRDVALDPDGRRLAIAGNHTVHILDTTTGVLVFTLTGHSAPVSGVAYSPDGRRLASVGEDRTVRVWDAPNGTEIFCLRGHTASIRAVAFSSGGQRLASYSRQSGGAGRPVLGEVMIWDLSKGEAVLTLPGRTGPAASARFASMTFSPDGEHLAASEGRIVRVWNVATGAEILTLPGDQGFVTRVAFSPDGRRLASASQDGSVKVWDAVTGEKCPALRGHTNAVNGLTYSPDGRRLVTAAGGTSRGGERFDSEAKLWDALTGQEILSLRGAFAQAPLVAFDRGGRRLAASGDAVVTVWEGVSLDAELALERQAASLVKYLFTRSPTPREVSARVRDDATISDAVRQQALTLVEPRWLNQVRQEAEQVVVLLFRKPLFRSEVLAHLRADPVLSAPVRQEALALAERWVEYPEILNRVSRAVAIRTGAEPSAYRLALDRAEIACRLMPFEGSYHTTLGMAQYRLGKYHAALTTLTRANQLNQTDHGGHAPADLAFLTMARYQIGQKDQARAILNQLRETMQKPNSARDEEVQSLLKEAEALLAGRALQPEK